jgi:hypothetical protein
VLKFKRKFRRLKVINNIKTMAVAKKCFYGELMSPATIKHA